MTWLGNCETSFFSSKNLLGIFQYSSSLAKHHQLKLLGVSVHKNFHYLTFFDPLKWDVVCAHSYSFFLIYGGDLFDTIAAREGFLEVWAVDARQQSPRGEELGFAANIEVDQICGDAVSGLDPLIGIVKLFRLFLQSPYSWLKIILLTFHLSLEISLPVFHLRFYLVNFR